MTSSRWLSEAQSLRLKVLDDIANGRAARAQECIYRNVFQLGVGETYIAGVTQIEVSLATSAEGQDYELVFSCAANEHSSTFIAEADAAVADRNARRVDGHSQRKAMLVLSRYASQKAEKVVPALPTMASRIRLIAFQCRVQCGGDVFALVALDGCIEVVWGRAEREMGITPLFSRDQKSGGARRLIEGIPKVFDDIVGQPADTVWDWLEAKFEFVPARLSIDLFDHSCRARIVEGFDERLKLIKLSLGPAR